MASKLSRGRWFVVFGILISVVAVTAAATPASVSSEAPATVEPGSQVTVSFTLQNTGNNNSAYILDLSIPTEWSVVDHFDAGGTWNSNESDWLWRNISSGEEVSPTVTIRVPDTANGEVSVSAVAKSAEGIEGETNQILKVTNETPTQSPSSTESPTTENETETTENPTTTATESGSTGSQGEGGDDSEISYSVTNTNSGATVNVRDAPIGGSFSADLPIGAVQTDGVAVQGVSVQMKFDNSRFRIEFTVPQESSPGSADPLDSADPMGYFTAQAFNVRASDIDQVKLHFSLSDTALPEETDPSEVTLYRYHDGSWSALSTSHLGGGQYTATSPGFSSFAIGVKEPEANTSTTDTDETVTSTATEEDTSKNTTPSPETEMPSSSTAEDSTETSGPGFGVISPLIALLLWSVRSSYRRE